MGPPGGPGFPRSAGLPAPRRVVCAAEFRENRGRQVGGLVLNTRIFGAEMEMQRGSPWFPSETTEQTQRIRDRSDLSAHILQSALHSPYAFWRNSKTPINTTLGSTKSHTQNVISHWKQQVLVANPNPETRRLDGKM